MAELFEPLIRLSGLALIVYGGVKMNAANKIVMELHQKKRAETGKKWVRLDAEDMVELRRSLLLTVIGIAMVVIPAYV